MLKHIARHLSIGLRLLGGRHNLVGEKVAVHLLFIVVLRFASERLFIVDERRGDDVGEPVLVEVLGCRGGGFRWVVVNVRVVVIRGAQPLVEVRVRPCPLVRSGRLGLVGIRRARLEKI